MIELQSFFVEFFDYLDVHNKLTTLSSLRYNKSELINKIHHVKYHYYRGF